MQDLAYIVRDAHIPSITKDAKHILWHLASREGENEASWPSTRTMSLSTNISQKGVQRAINCLLDHGLISVESGKQLGRANRYRVTLPEAYITAWYEEHGKRRKVGQRVRPSVGRNDLPEVGQTHGGGGTTPVARSDTMTHVIETKKSNIKPTETLSQSVSAAPTDSPTAVQAVISKLGNGKFSVDKQYACRIAYNLGLSNGECTAFWRYNQTRGWPLLGTMSLEDIAKAWLDKWLKSEPSGYGNEIQRRKQAAYEAELRVAQARVAAESENTQK